MLSASTQEGGAPDDVGMDTRNLRRTACPRPCPDRVGASDITCSPDRVLGDRLSDAGVLASREASHGQRRVIAREAIFETPSRSTAVHESQIAVHRS